MNEAPQKIISTEILKVKPTHIAQKCPTCNGFGTVTSARRVCHGCDGKGYILIPCEPMKEGHYARYTK